MQCGTRASIIGSGDHSSADRRTPSRGPAGDGTTQGPPLVHIIYEPNHHADVAFLLAARNGVQAHHWRFGDMPPVPGVTDEIVLEIVGYIRWLQRQVGIE